MSTNRQFVFYIIACFVCSLGSSNTMAQSNVPDSATYRSVQDARSQSSRRIQITKTVTGPKHNPPGNYNQQPANRPSTAVNTNLRDEPKSTSSRSGRVTTIRFGDSAQPQPTGIQSNIGDTNSVSTSSAVAPPTPGNTVTEKRSNVTQNLTDEVAGTPSAKSTSSQQPAQSTIGLKTNLSDSTLSQSNPDGQFGSSNATAQKSSRRSATQSQAPLPMNRPPAAQNNVVQNSKSLPPSALTNLPQTSSAPAKSSSTVHESFGDQNKEVTPGSASRIGTGMSLKDLAGTRFKQPEKFLSNKSLQFGDASKYLNQPMPPQSESLDSASLPKARLATKIPAKRASTRINASNNSTPSYNFRSPFDGEEDQYLLVASVDEPIGDVPFQNITQEDSFNLLAKDVAREVPLLSATTYGDFTGHYYQGHVASYQAHHFKHRPLYFEEVNLERYGNQVPFQGFASAAHFFTSAALLPYKMGASPPNCCISTLGHQRPGDCVPYQIHRQPTSVRGLIYQGLAITAISL